MVDISHDDIVAFQEKVLSWYGSHKRFLPWRNTANPYHILVSEVMSQQTRVDRVIGYYDSWLLNLPDFYALATVDTRKLLTLWSGLGYNSRALRLRQLAGVVIQEYGGFLPDDYDELIKLPGIGDYTASAILVFAFGKEVPVIDTNIRRVLMHEFNLSKDTPLDVLRSLASRCIPKGNAKQWYNALMDYGALVKTARKTGIKPLSSQGKFKGSDREVRGFIIKELTKKKSLSLNAILAMFPLKHVDGIIKKMSNDGLVVVNGNTVSLS